MMTDTETRCGTCAHWAGDTLRSPVGKCCYLLALPVPTWVRLAGIKMHWTQGTDCDCWEEKGND